MSTTNDEQAPSIAELRAKATRALVKAFGPALLQDGNTVDITAEVMDKPTERAPLLSDEAMIELARLTEYPSKSAENVRDFYEALLTSGELRVVKKATDDGGHFDDPTCSVCARKTTDWENFCPGCGAQIIKE